MKRRPIVFITLAYMSGIIIQGYLKLDAKVTLMLIVISIVFTFVLYFFNRKLVLIMLLLSFSLLGVLNIEYLNLYGNNLENYMDKEVEIIGIVYKENINDNKNHILIAEKIITNKKIMNIDKKVIMKLYDNRDKKDMEDKRIKVKGIIRKPQLPRNPNMFNYRMYLKSKKIFYILYANTSNVKIIDSQVNSLSVLGLRNAIKDYIYKKTLKILPNNGQVILSIAFGDKNVLNKDLYEDFKLSGIAHILAVSGLHFGLLYISLNSILSKLRIKEGKRVFIILLSIWVFALIVGFTPSATRASTMISLFTLANLLDRRYDIFASIASVSLIILLINPFLMYNVGFQLSFAAVLSIALFYNTIYNLFSFLPDYINKLISASLSAQLGTIPLIAYYFNLLSTWSIIFNTAAVLLVGYLVPIIFVFFISLFIYEGIAIVLAPLLKLLIKTLIYISMLHRFIPFSTLNMVSPSPVFFIMYYSFIIIIMIKGLNKGLDKRKMILGLLLIYLSFFSIVNIYPRDLNITFVDVGQGDCALIQTPKRKTILIDGGRSINGSFLKDFLLKNRVSKLDLIIISHIHNDHIEGIIDVIGQINIGLIIMPKAPYSSVDSIELIDSAHDHGIRVVNIKRKQNIEIEEDLVIKSLNPPENILKNTRDDINNNSLVVLVDYKNFEVLFTGDIEKEGENDIITKVNDLDIDVLKVSHHGSDTSTTNSFLDFLNPEAAIIQVGRNSYGHPHERVLANLSKNKIDVYRNDINGAVTIKTDGNKYRIYKTLDK